jgi:hypothetical protein
MCITIHTIRFRITVMLQLTVSQSLRLALYPVLCDYTHIKNAYTHIRHTEYSHSQSPSYVATDGQSVRLGVSISGTRDQILVVVWTNVVLSWGVLLVERTGFSCNRSQSLSVSSNIYIRTFWVAFINMFLLIISFILILILIIYILNKVCLCTRQACQPRFYTADYAYCSYTAQGYDHNLGNWSVICLTATKFEPFIFFVLSFVLTNVANITFSWFCMTAVCWVL